MLDLPSVETGFAFPVQTIELDAETVSAYVSAVGDSFEGYMGEHAVVPPLAALALAMRCLTEVLVHFPGVLHLTLQLTSHKPIPIGSTVTATLVVRSRSERRGYAALNLDAHVLSEGKPVLEGGLLLMVPLHAREVDNG